MPSLALDISLRGLLLSGTKFSPTSLFASSEPGVWYDPSDLTTLFQDSAGTTPVTAAGQPVGLMLDKSGNNNHATQSTAASRPTYQIAGTGRPYLFFDGVDDFLVTPTITPGIDKVQVFAGVRKLSDAFFQSIAETSTNVDTNTGSFCLAVNTINGDAFRRTWGTVLSGTVPRLLGGAALYPAPDTRVVTLLNDISQSTAAAEAIMRLNGAVQSLTFSDGTAGTGNFAAYPLYIGRRGGTLQPFNGNLYGLIVRFGANLDASSISNAETWMNQKTGAY